MRPLSHVDLALGRVGEGLRINSLAKCITAGQGRDLHFTRKVTRRPSPTLPKSAVTCGFFEEAG